MYLRGMSAACQPDNYHVCLFVREHNSVKYISDRTHIFTWGFTFDLIFLKDSLDPHCAIKMF